MKSHSQWGTELGRLLSLPLHAPLVGHDFSPGLEGVSTPLTPETALMWLSPQICSANSLSANTYRRNLHCDLKQKYHCTSKYGHQDKHSVGLHHRELVEAEVSQEVAGELSTCCGHSLCGRSYGGGGTSWAQGSL